MLVDDAHFKAVNNHELVECRRVIFFSVPQHLMQIWRFYEQIKNWNLQWGILFQPHKFVVKPIYFYPVSWEHLSRREPLLTKSIEDFAFQSEYNCLMVELNFELSHFVFHGLLFQLIELVIYIIDVFSVFLHDLDQPLIDMRFDFLFLSCAHWLQEQGLQKILGDLLPIKKFGVIIGSFQRPPTVSKMVVGTFKTSQEIYSNF